MMKNSKQLVAGVGELLWDLFPHGKELGGAPANFAYHASSLGYPAAIVSCLGDDQLGDEAVNLLAARGLSTEFLGRHPEKKTGTVSVTLDDRGVPGFTIRDDAAWDHIQFGEGLRRLAGGLKAVCFGSLAQRHSTSKHAILEFIRSTGASCYRVFDVNLRQSFFTLGLIVESMRLCNVLKINGDELTVISRMLGESGEPLEILKKWMTRYSIPVIALTRGESGSILMHKDHWVDHPGVSVPRLQDTVGAGDAFSAALVAGLLKGWNLDRISAYANRRAAAVCAHRGAMPVLNSDSD